MRKFDNLLSEKDECQVKSSKLYYLFMLVFVQCFIVVHLLKVKKRTIIQKQHEWRHTKIWRNSLDSLRGGKLFSIKQNKNTSLETIFYNQNNRQSQSSTDGHIQMGAHPEVKGKKTTSSPSKMLTFTRSKQKIYNRHKTKAMGNWRQSYLFHVYPHAMMMRISRCLQRIGFFFTPTS